MKYFAFVIASLVASAASAADITCHFEWPERIEHSISITGKDVLWSSPRQVVEATATVRRNPIGTVWNFMVAPEFFISVIRESSNAASISNAATSVTVHKSGKDETFQCEAVR